MRLSPECYFQMLDSLPALIWASGDDARCTYFNKSWLAFTGRKLEEELGDGWADGVHPGDFEYCVQTYLDSFHARQPFKMEYRLRHRDGSYRWISNEGRPMFDSKGGFRGYLGYCCDITEQKLHTESLRESEQSFQNLARISPVGIFRTDADAHCYYVNLRWAEITGMPVEEAMGRGWLSNLHPEDRTSTFEKVDESFRLREELNHECRFVKAEGEIVWVLLQGRPEFDDQGILRSFVGTVTDITRSAQQSDEELKINKIESLGVLAGGIAHDFNNLLTPILLNLSIAKNQLPAEESLEELQDRMDEAEQAAFRAKNLTQQLLTFAKGGVPVKKAVTLGDLIQEAAHFALHGSRIETDFSLAEDLWAAHVDVGQLNQVLQNILVNAVQAMDHGGRVWIKADNVEDINHPALAPVQGRYLCVQIEDEGEGIPQENLIRIFDPYFSTRVNGNGLGLATALSIVRKHGGLLHVESELGRGTIFYLYLPAADPGDILGRPKHLAVPGRGNILIMDDEELVRNSMEAMLKTLGYKVSTARDGNEALEMYRRAQAEKNPIDLILMDLTVQGGMGGKRAVQEVKTIDPEAKVVVCSGYSNDPVMAEFKDHGFQGAIQKPFRPEELHALLSELLAS